MTKQKRLIRKILFKRVLYLGDKNYTLNWDSSIEETGSDFPQKARVVILGRKYYFETSKRFPFSNLRDIRSAVKTDISAHSPFKTDRFFLRKTGKSDENTSVNIWFVDEKLSDILRSNSPTILIPETAIFSFLESGKGALYTVRREGGNLMIHVGPTGVVKSIFERGDESNTRNFRRCIGAEARDCPEKNITEFKEYLSLLSCTLSTVPLRSLLCFADVNFFPLSSQKSKRHLRLGLVAAATLFFLYSGISGFLIHRTKSGLQREDRALSQNLSAVIESQTMIESYCDRQKILALTINRYAPKLALINTLNRILPEKTTIRQLKVSGNGAQIIGAAEKASDLLTALSGAKELKNARFTSPLREERGTGMEIFTIDFVYEPIK